MRKQIVAGNWKMNLDKQEGQILVSEIANMVADERTTDTAVIVCPPFPHLSQAQALLKDAEGVHLGAQNCAEKESGAFTGEVSAKMLRSFGVEYVILGHSERRAIFNERFEGLRAKVDQVLANQMSVIFCCGEMLNEREENRQQEVVKQQLAESLFHIDEAQLQHIVIAYEPVWAIGTGKTASDEQAQEMHSFIRQQLSSKYSAEAANRVPILYGGSVKPNNARKLFTQPDVDGGLIGGASLKSRDFTDIVKAF